MLSKSSDANQSNTGQAASAFPFLFPMRSQPKEFSFQSDFFSRDAECQQTFFRDIAVQPAGECASAIAPRGLRPEAIPTLGMLAKRILDLELSSAALLVLWPLMFVIAIAVKLESRGPAIYASLRVGKRGIPFVCYKFRTMIPGANRLRKELYHLNQRREPFFKIANDPRVTPLGRFLRKYSLDELPQFWNVLKGDMSLVGPRPHPLEDVEHTVASVRARKSVLGSDCTRCVL